MRSLFYVLPSESFHLVTVLLSMYFGMMYDDCCSVISDLTSVLDFTNGRLLFEVLNTQNV